jgi:histidinol-phosphate aminotransferase
MYRVSIQSLGGRIREVLRKEDFSDDIDSLIEEGGKPEVRAVFLCSPNNPTGNILEKEEVISLLEKVDCAVIVDESYAEFSGETLVDLTEKYGNLIVIRTFSKAFCLAGVRIGYLVANKDTINLLNFMRPPNSVSTISLALAKLALENISYIVEGVKKVVSERERLQDELKSLPKVTVYPSKANFVLIRFNGISSSTVYDRLLKEGIVVRKLSGPMLENCLRITVRLRKDNDKLINALKRILS